MTPKLEAMEPLIYRHGLHAVKSALNEITLEQKIAGGSILDAWKNKSPDLTVLSCTEIAEIVFVYMLLEKPK